MVSLRLIDTNEELVIEQQPFPVELNSTAFGDVIPGSRVYEIKLPVEPNEAKLGHANFVEVNQNFKAYDVELLQEGLSKLIGKLNIRKYSDAYLFGAINVNPFAQDVGNKSLKDLAWPSDHLLGYTKNQIALNAGVIATKLYPEANFCFPSMIAPDFYGSRPGDWSGIINGYNSGGQTFLVNEITGNGEHNDNLNTLVPQLYLRFLLKYIFEENGWKLQGTFVNDEIMNHAFWFSNYALDRVPEESFYASVISSSESQRLSGSRIQEFKGLLFETVVKDDDSCMGSFSYQDPNLNQQFEITTYTVQQTGDHIFKIHLDQIDYHNVVSYEEIVSMEDTIYFVLRNLTTSTNVDTQTYVVSTPLAEQADVDITLNLPSGSANPGDVFYVYAYRIINLTEKKLFGTTSKTIDGMIDLSGSRTMKVRNTQYPSLNIYATHVHYANHVQDMKVSKFLLDIRDFFCLQYKFDYRNKSVTIDWVEDMMNRTAEKLPKARYAKSNLVKLDPHPGFTLNYNLDIDQDDIPNPNDHNFLGTFAGPWAAPNPKMGDLFYSNLYHRYYISKLDENDNTVWEPAAYNYRNKIIGDGSKERKLAITPFEMDNGYMDSKNFLLPKFSGQGSSPMFEIGTRDPKPKIGYYFGIQEPGGPTNRHPFATSLELLPDYTVHNLPRLTLDDHYRSIYIHKMKSFYEFLVNAKEVEWNLLIPDEEVDSYDFAQPEVVDGVVYIRKQLLYEISNQWPYRAKVILLTK